MKRGNFILLGLFLYLHINGTSIAQVTNSNLGGGTSDWSNATTWDTGVPNPFPAGDTANILAGDTVTWDYFANGTFDDGEIPNTLNISGTWIQNNGFNRPRIGRNNSNPVVNINTGGVFDGGTASSISIGSIFGSSPSVNLDDGIMQIGIGSGIGFISGNINVINNGTINSGSFFSMAQSGNTANLLMTDGDLNARGDIVFGNSAGSSANVTTNGNSTISSNNILVGDDGATANVNFNGNSNITLGNVMELGDSDGGIATVNFNDNASLDTTSGVGVGLRFGSSLTLNDDSTITTRSIYFNDNDLTNAEVLSLNGGTLSLDWNDSLNNGIWGIGPSIDDSIGYIDFIGYGSGSASLLEFRNTNDISAVVNKFIGAANPMIKINGQDDPNFNMFRVWTDGASVFIIPEPSAAFLILIGNLFLFRRKRY